MMPNAFARLIEAHGGRVMTGSPISQFIVHEGECKGFRLEDGAEMLGILNCGDCPGAGIATRMGSFKHWNGPMEELPTKIHIAPCILTGCPHKEVLISKIKAKAGIDVIEGTHPYKPQTIFS